MDLKSITAKVTGLEPRITALESAVTSANENAENIKAELTEAQTKLSTITAERDTLATEKGELAKERDTLTAKVAELEANAETVTEAASRQAVDIVASQGAEAAPEADNVEGSQNAPAEKSTAELLDEMAALPVADRPAFYKEHRDKLNPYKAG